MRPDRRFPATLKEVTTTADPATRTYEATLAFQPPDDAGILPGMTARAIVGGGAASAADTAQTDTLQADSSQAVTIPISAVFSRSSGDASVWAVGDSSMTVTRRSVSLGPVRDSTVVVTSGLRVGEQIAATGVHQLTDGQSVRPLQ
jgi:multidrug efflux pump subunit AcrA (membrane-fusion protein)